MILTPIRVLPFVSSVCWSTATANSKGQHLFLREKVAESHPNLALTSTAPSFLWQLLEGCTLGILHWWGSSCPRVLLLCSPAVQGRCWRRRSLCWACGSGRLLGRAGSPTPATELLLQPDDSRKGWAVLPGGSDTYSASLFSRRQKSYLACGVQFFCTFTTTSGVLWKQWIYCAYHK